ncbi:MAG: VWA domain-containing protein [Deltaproteobacteria bacterium]|nr:VWA domain-containing protein [Deltaproteobacteria bacterium]MBW2395214.1 VWA domain-containing protein [Deltaproteobacteria bacterium]
MRAFLLIALLASVSITAAFSDTGTLGASPAAGPTGAAKSPGRVELTISSPAPGARVESKMHMAEIRGTATAGADGPRGFDVMLVLDVSRSTQTACGADVDGDGEIGEDPHQGLYAPGEFPDDVYSTDPEDTVLHAEVLAARTLIEGLDSKRVRVGLVTFSGEVDPTTGLRRAPEQHDAELRVPLTRDHASLLTALDEVLREGPHGATNFAAGIRLATQELAGMSGAQSRPADRHKKVMLFLTDGIPSFPAGRADTQDPEDMAAAVRAARVSQAAGIRINSFALGTDALARPKAATEIAAVTLGTFTPVIEPAGVVAALQAVNFANVEDIGVANVTTQEVATDVHLNPDGSFIAFVPVKVGRNKVIINALSSDGAETNQELVFEFSIKEAEDAEKRRQLARLRKMSDEMERYLLADEMKRKRNRDRMERVLDIQVREGNRSQ